MKDQFLIEEGIIKGQPPSMKNEKTQYLLNIQNTCCCKIETKNIYGSGILCNIPFPDFFHLLPVLITNNHVLNAEDIKMNKEINFSLKDNMYQYKIKIDESRITYTNSTLDITFIEIKKQDNLEINKFIGIDEGIYEGNPYKNYKGKEIYLLHYPKGYDSEFSLSEIINIDPDNFRIRHKCSSEKGSSGGSLINSLNFKVIGIHKGYNDKKKI